MIFHSVDKCCVREIIDIPACLDNDNNSQFSSSSVQASSKSASAEEPGGMSFGVTEKVFLFDRR